MIFKEKKRFVSPDSVYGLLNRVIRIDGLKKFSLIEIDDIIMKNIEKRANVNISVDYLSFDMAVRDLYIEDKRELKNMKLKFLENTYFYAMPNWGAPYVEFKRPVEICNALISSIEYNFDHTMLLDKLEEIYNPALLVFYLNKYEKYMRFSKENMVFYLSKRDTADLDMLVQKVSVLPNYNPSLAALINKSVEEAKGLEKGAVENVMNLKLAKELDAFDPMLKTVKRLDAAKNIEKYLGILAKREKIR